MHICRPACLIIREIEDRGTVLSDPTFNSRAIVAIGSKRSIRLRIFCRSSFGVVLYGHPVFFPRSMCPYCLYLAIICCTLVRALPMISANSERDFPTLCNYITRFLSGEDILRRITGAMIVCLRFVRFQYCSPCYLFTS